MVISSGASPQAALAKATHLRRPCPDGPPRLHSKQLRLAPTPDSGPVPGLGRFPTHRA